MGGGVTVNNDLCILEALNLLAEMRAEVTVSLHSAEKLNRTEAAIKLEAMANRVAELARQIQCS